MNIIKKMKLWWTAENRAPITPRNIYAVLQGYWRKSFNKSSHIEEQVTWRLTQADPICIQRGSCRNCGCEMSGKVYEDRGCELGCYPNMMNTSDWEQFKSYIKKKKL